MSTCPDDYGREGQIDGEALEGLFLNTDPMDVLKGVKANPPSPDSMMFLKFVLKTAHGGIGKEEFVKHIGSYDPEDLDFTTKLCHVDILTNTDMAFRGWQFCNSYLDWGHKCDNRDNKKARYICKTRFTSDKRTFATDGEESPVVQGERLYTKILDWCKRLKGLKDTREYVEFRGVMIKVADEMGMLGSAVTRKRKSKSQATEVVQAAVFDDDAFGLVAAV